MKRLTRKQFEVACRLSRGETLKRIGAAPSTVAALMRRGAVNRSGKLTKAGFREVGVTGQMFG